MKNTFTFQQEGIDQAINDVNRLVFKPEQKVIVENFAKIINSFVPVNELALKGFINNVIIEWQKETNEKVSSIAEWEPTKRLESVRDMFMKLYRDLAGILKHKNESGKLEAAIKEAFEFYKKEFAYR